MKQIYFRFIAATLSYTWLLFYITIRRHYFITGPDRLPLILIFFSEKLFTITVVIVLTFRLSAI